MPKIHFASLFSVDLDADIVTHWCSHYLAADYDTYTVFLHTMDRKMGAYKFCRKRFETAGFTVLDAPNEPYTIQMQTTIFDNFSESFNPLDYLVIADSDELQSPDVSRELVLSCDILYGTLIDRWGDSLKAASPTPSLAKQYPYSGNLFSILQEASDAPDKMRWRKPNPNKILAARAGMPVAYQGSHCLYHQVDEATEKHGCIVEHYSWRHNVSARLKTKFYYSVSFDRAVAAYFRKEGAYCDMSVQKGIPA
jgi:hypothetical protein